MKRNKTSSQVLFWTRIPHDTTDEWVLKPGKDAGGVPPKVWKAFNKSFWQWKSSGKLYPLDEMDAYQFAASELIYAARHLPHLERSTPETYLVAAAYKALVKYRTRQVLPRRDEYRAMSEMPNVADFVETLDGTSAYAHKTAMRQAAVCVYETLEKLDSETARGLRAWLTADGNLTLAAQLYGCSRPWFKRQFLERWCPAFRKACAWVW